MTKYFLTIAICVLSISLGAQEVAQWRGPNRSGVYNETGLMREWPATGPGMLWHFDGLGEGYSSAAVTSSAIYVT